MKGAIFDLDGTLLDSMHLWNSLGSEYLLQRGLQPEAGLNETFKNLSIIQAAEYYRAHYPIKDSVEEIVRGINQMIEQVYFEQVEPKAGAGEYLARLYSRGVALCIATATDRYLVEAALKRTGLERYFSAVFTCTEEGAGKDRPDIYEKALSWLALPKGEVVVFEDALYAVKTAKRAGFTVAAVYDCFAHSNWAEIVRLCDYTIKSYQALDEGALK